MRLIGGGVGHRFGDDFLDLQEIIKERDYLTDNPEAWDEDDEQFMELVGQLEDELWTDLDEYAYNEPTLIRDTCFEDYAADFISDVYGIDLSNWPFYRLNMKEIADDLKEDYGEYEIGQYTYYGRNY